MAGRREARRGTSRREIVSRRRRRRNLRGRGRMGGRGGGRAFLDFRGNFFGGF
jgi:hypothetical protein